MSLSKSNFDKLSYHFDKLNHHFDNLSHQIPNVELNSSSDYVII
ncbi:MAG: hypothetical protein V4616_01320 [Bacteroidota bacterium]